MATVNFIPCKKQCRSSMKGTIDYVKKDFKVCIRPEAYGFTHADTYQPMPEQERATQDFDGCIRLVSGKDCSPESAYNEFMATKKAFGKADGRFFYHYDQSFGWDERVSPRLAHEIALRFAEENYKGFEVLVATHVDKQHIHSHFIINSVSFEDGRKLRQTPNTLKQLRASSDEICRAFGLTTLQPYEKLRSNAVSQREKRAAMRGQSWKFRLMSAIDQCMNCSRTRGDFIRNMEKLGYGVSWDNRKTVCYTTPKGYKCRDDRLHEPKYLKENIEREFRIRAVEVPQRRGRLGFAEAVPVGGLRDSQRAVGGDVASVDGQSLDASGDYRGSGYARDRGRFGGVYRPDIDGRTGFGAEGQDGDASNGGGFARANDQPVVTGWELSRAELKRPSSANGFVTEPIQADDVQAVEAPGGLAGMPDGIAGGVVRLAADLARVIDGEPERRQVPRAIRERKRHPGQRQDDHSEEEQGMRMY